jgi:hypothetical protein
MWFIDDRYMSDMLPYIYKPFAIVVSAYLLQSSLKNKNNIKNDYNTEKKKKITFSKSLILLITFSFFISVFFFSIVWVYINRFPTDLFDYIALPFITALPSYLAKDIIEKDAAAKVDTVTFGNLVESIVNIATGGVDSSVMSTFNNAKNVITGLTKVNEKGEEITEEENNTEIDEEETSKKVKVKIKDEEDESS